MANDERSEDFRDRHTPAGRRAEMAVGEQPAATGIDSHFR